ncbi:hypothetical protein RvY_01608 [Ramazzottius varieornatus]|uniref:Epidermal growth factor receptor substrate 15-like 1 n=1 Tax=Ramazzottius varieornatus TaxID=947166 RepID=A0A1D1UGY5_RAMVA|nr:hypothetical protein RvY_01608 [Ramazzottius varieornatus]
MADPFGDNLSSAFGAIPSIPVNLTASLTGNRVAGDVSASQGLYLLSGQSFSSIVPTPVIAVWSVPATEKTKSDAIFLTLDQDHDGLVNGGECKGIFLQSTLPPPILAQIWALCDVRKNGMLNQEQFALAFHLIQQKLRNNIDPPATLPPDLVPPSMRMYTTQFHHPGILPQPELDDDEGGDEGLKKELKDLEEEIAQIKTDKAKLVHDVEGRKSEIQMRQSELQNLAKELDALQTATKQLDVQRGEAQKRLDDLDSQKNRLQSSVSSAMVELERERERTREMKEELEKRQVNQNQQQSEMQKKRAELNRLKQEESVAQQKLEAYRQQLSTLQANADEGDRRILQLEEHVKNVMLLNTTLQAAIGEFDAALASQDISLVKPEYLQKSAAEFTFSAGAISFDPVSSDVALKTASFAPTFHSSTNDDPFHGADPFAKPQAATHGGFGVGFGVPFGGGPVADDPWGASPFGGGGGGADQWGFSDNSGFSAPALPPKKTGPAPSSGASKQPPPRPAPPKAAGRTGPGKKENPSPARDADPWGSVAANDGSAGNVGYGFPAFEQPKPASFATDFDDFGKF